jgi:glycosyltransferase involved in cell wall biosynthesis
VNISAATRLREATGQCCAHHIFRVFPRDAFFSVRASVFMYANARQPPKWDLFVPMNNGAVDSTDGSTPALSVVMPAYNAEIFIDEAIESVLSQTFTDLELIVVDDASTDGTWEVVSKHAAADTRVKVFRNDINVGAAGSTNRGIGLARATLIGRMDADDVSLPTRFEKQVDALRNNPHYAVVGTFASHTNEAGKILGLSPTGPRSEDEFNALRAAGKPTMVFGGTALFTKALFERVGGFDPDIRSAEDLELFDRMAEHGPVVTIEESLLLYRLHPGSTVGKTFFEGRQVHRYVRARRRARSTGVQPLDLQQFKEWEQEQTIWSRFRTWNEDTGQFHFRAAGMAYGQRDWVRFVWHLVRAFISNPVWVVRRLWKQRLSPAAREKYESAQQFGD